MCGLAGVAAFGDRCLEETDRRALASMSQAVRHRGPDDARIFETDRVAFGFRRLSVIDLAGGAQPFVSGDGRVVAMVNGEIYNHRSLRTELEASHRFTTHSDCEVLLHLYEDFGAAAFERLRGMFAAAVFDRASETVLLARDRFGIKPLFYAVDRERLLFGSEMKALFRHPRCPRRFDWKTALSDPAVNGHPANPAGPAPAYFEGIAAVPAASVIRFDLRTSESREMRYWAFAGGTPPRSADEAIAGYRELFVDAVTEELSSDVGVGLFLSGGIDSASIAAVAARSAEREITTFSVLTESTVANGDAELAAASANALGLANHQVLLTQRELPQTAHDYLDLLALSESPLFGGEELYKFALHRYAKAACPDLKVILTGQGSDEFNGGYTSLFGTDWDDQLALLQRLQRGRMMMGPKSALAIWEDRLEMPVLGEAVLGDSSSAGGMDDPWLGYVRGKYRDLQTYNCWHEDRTAAGNGIENRVPFLDHRLVELCLSVPPELRAELLWDKRILREAVRDVLPARIAGRPKIAFFYGPGLRRTNRMILDMFLRDSGELLELSCAAAASYLDPGALRTIVRRVDQDPNLDHFDFVLRLLNMGLLDHLARTERFEFRGPRETPIGARVCEDRLESVSRELVFAGVSGSEVLAFAPDVALLERVDSGSGDRYFISVEDRLGYAFDDGENAWLRVLRSIDGKRSIAEIVGDLHLSIDTIRDDLAESLNAGVIRVAVEQ